MWLLVARGPFSSLSDPKAPKPPSLRLRWVSEIKYSRSLQFGGEASIENHSRRIGVSLAGATAHAAPTRADDCSPASAASIAPAKASRARDGLSGLAADSRREDLDGRQCLRAVERRLAFDVVFRGATDRNHQSRRHTGGQLPHGLPETRRPSERRRGGVAADRTRSNRKTAEARIWTFDFSGMPPKSKGDIQPPARPASL